MVMRRATPVWMIVGCAMTATLALAKDVIVQSDPPGATVTVDGRVLGKTPLQTTKKEIMPTWFFDGTITSATMTLELPLYEPQSRTFNEFRVPKLIEFNLVRQDLQEQFENYLSEVPGLEGNTVSATEMRVTQSQDLDSDGQRLFLDGLVMVGYLGVTSEVAPLELIKERGRQLGAMIAIMSTTSAGTRTEVRAITTRTAGTMVTSNAFGSASIGGQTAFGSAHGMSFIPGRSST